MPPAVPRVLVTVTLRVFSKDGVDVLVDNVSLEFIKGSTLDYTEDMMRAAFSVCIPWILAHSVRSPFIHALVITSFRGQYHVFMLCVRAL
jgi:hypothetical protein